MLSIEIQKNELQTCNSTPLPCHKGVKEHGSRADVSALPRMFQRCWAARSVLLTKYMPSFGYKSAGQKIGILSQSTKG